MAFLHLDSSHGTQDEIQLEDIIDMKHYPKGYERYARVHWKALVNYFPKPYSGKVVLFESTRSPGALAVEVIWKSLARGGLDVKKIPCEHETMLDEPHVQILADELSACLGQGRRGEVKACAA